MIPLQVASSGRPGTRKKEKYTLSGLPDPSAGCLFRSSWNGSYKQKQNVLESGRGEREKGSRKNEKCTLSGLPDDPSAGCLFRSSWNGSYKQKQNVLESGKGVKGKGFEEKRKLYLKWSS